MVNILEFIYGELKLVSWLSTLVDEKIFYWKAPIKTTSPLLIYKEVSNAKINARGTRNDFIQVSIWWEDGLENENIKQLLVQHFHMLKKSPVKNVNVKNITPTFDKWTWMFWLHLTLHVKLQDNF